MLREKVAEIWRGICGEMGKRPLLWRPAQNSTMVLLTSRCETEIEKGVRNHCLPVPSSSALVLALSHPSCTPRSSAYRRQFNQWFLTPFSSLNCYDNAVAESFFSTLKNDLVHERDYQTREEALAEIIEFIEVFYNRQRLHQTLGYVSPEQFETQNPVPLRGCLRKRG